MHGRWSRGSASNVSSHWEGTKGVVRAGRGWGGTDDENVEVLVEDETEGEDAGRGDDAAHEVDIGGAQVPAQAWIALQLPGSIAAGPCLLQ